MRADRYKQTDTVKRKKKRSRTNIVLLLLILLLLAAIPAAIQYSYKSTLDSIYVEFSDDNLSIEVGDPLSIDDCIKESSGDLSYSGTAVTNPGSPSPTLDTDTIGEKELKVKASKSMYGGLLKPGRTYSMKYNVTDETPPLMLWSGDGSVIKLGSKFNIEENISYGDNADPSPTVTYEGSVNTDKEGTYPLHVTVSDASGNSTDWDMSVKVAEIIPSYNESSERYPFSDFIKDHAGEGRSFGLDVSEWQGDIDFNKVKAAGCEFVIIRIGYSHDGKVTMDGKFEQNYKAARDAGLRTGVYVYSYDDSEEEVRSTASWILDQMEGREAELPIVFDWEDFGLFQSHEISFNELNRLYDFFADEIEKSSRFSAMLYGSMTYLEKVWTDTGTRPVWLAHYTDKTNYEEPYRIWQASSSGRIDGISAAVDMNIMYEE